MSTLRDEFIAVMRRFPSYADTPESTIEVLYQDFLDARASLLAEPMDYFKYRFFDISDAARMEFLTRRQYAELCARVNDADLVASLEDKAAFYNRFSAYLGRRYAVACEGDRTTFDELCEQNSRVVVKPRRSGYGCGIEICDTDNPDALWQACCENEAIVEELLVQHADLARLHPTSVNSARVVTVLDEEGSASIIAAALRYGRNGSATDSGDPLIVGIDLVSGAVVTSGASHFGERFEAHPDTGIAFTGITVPNWAGLAESSRSAAEENPGLRLMNWDWACREDGVWCLIEGNFSGGLGPCQEAHATGLARVVFDSLELPSGGWDA